MADALAEKLDDIERIDRLTSIAEADALAEKLDDIERIDRLTSIAESHRRERLHHSGPRRREIHLESLRMRRFS